MEKSSFFNSISGDRKYKAEEWAEYFASFISNGVFPQPSNGLQVMANGSMTISVKAGKAWINGYFYLNTSDLAIAVDTADGVLSRIDRVVVRWDLGERKVRVKIKKGIYSESPSPPALQRDADAYELALADIAVNRGTITLSQASITDRRYKADLCGIVVSTVQQIDFATITAQFDTFFAEYKPRIEQEFNTYTAQCNNFFTLYRQLVLEKLNEFIAVVGGYEADGKTAYTALLAWFEAFKLNSTAEFTAWFDEVKDILTTDAAGSLAAATQALTRRVEELEKRVDEIGVFYGKAWLGGSFLGVAYLSNIVSAPEVPEEGAQEGWLNNSHLGCAYLTNII